MVYMEAMTTLILDELFDAIEYTCWMYRSVSVEVQSSFVVMYAVLWLQANIDEDARVVEMSSSLNQIFYVLEYFPAIVSTYLSNMHLC